MLKSVLIVAFGLAYVHPALATTFLFGEKTELHKISDTTIHSAKGELLSLGHKVTIYSFLAGFGLSDDGYVLLTPGEKRYFELSQADIEKYQSQGSLPKPLPPYRIPIGDWIDGSVLWWVVGISVGVTMLGKKLNPEPKGSLSDALKGEDAARPPG